MDRSHEPRLATAPKARLRTETEAETTTPIQSFRAVPRPQGLAMALAFEASRASLEQARHALAGLASALRSQQEPDASQTQVVRALERWLLVEPPRTAASRTRLLTTLTVAIRCIDRNLAVRTSSDGHPAMRRADVPFSARASGTADDGIDCGPSFFSVDDPHHRRDAITREMFRLAGVGRDADFTGLQRAVEVNTTAQALESPNHLVRLVASIVD